MPKLCRWASTIQFGVIVAGQNEKCEKWMAIQVVMNIHRSVEEAVGLSEHDKWSGLRYNVEIRAAFYNHSMMENMIFISGANAVSIFRQNHLKLSPPDQLESLHLEYYYQFNGIQILNCQLK